MVSQRLSRRPKVHKIDELQNSTSHRVSSTITGPLFCPTNPLFQSSMRFNHSDSGDHGGSDRGGDEEWIIVEACS
jgi:hypothetical protein